MHNFVWYNPTKILFGKGNIPAIGRETPFFGRHCLSSLQSNRRQNTP